MENIYYDFNTKTKIVVKSTIDPNKDISKTRQMHVK
jgi:hypothetical protein